MTPHEPPRLAVAILERFLPDNAPLTGDLLEVSRTRSRAWFWCQVLLAIVTRAFAEVRAHKRMTAEALLVSAAMLALLAFHAVVGASLINRMRQLYDPLAVPGGASGGASWHAVAALLAFFAAIAIGRAIGRLHRDNRLAAVVLLSASATAAAFVDVHYFAQPPVWHTAFLPPEVGVHIVTSMVFIAGLFTGVALGAAPVRSGAIAVMAMLTAAALQPAALAQSPDQRTFEVASIKRNVSDTVSGAGLAAPQPGGRYVGVGVTLRRLVSDAYDSFDIVGGPDWVSRDRFDVNARADGEPSPAEIRRMLRPLLADRFKLEVHTEPRDMAVYEMRLVREDARLGPGLTPSDAKCAEEARNFVSGQMGFPPPCGDYRLGAGAFVARGMTMAGLSRLLTSRTGRPVIDRTGLDAAYDIEMKWTSDGGLRPMPPDTAGVGTLSADGVTLFTALREQVGLRLDASRAPVDVLVIDSAEPPTPD